MREGRVEAFLRLFFLFSFEFFGGLALLLYANIWEGTGK